MSQRFDYIVVVQDQQARRLQPVSVRLANVCCFWKRVAQKKKISGSGYR